MSVTLWMLFAIISFIIVFQIYSTVVSLRNNKVEQIDLNFTIISCIIISIIPLLDKNIILSIVGAIVIVLIIIRLILSFIYFTFILRKN